MARKNANLILFRVMASSFGKTGIYARKYIGIMWSKIGELASRECLFEVVKIDVFLEGEVLAKLRYIKDIQGGVVSQIRI